MINLQSLFFFDFSSVIIMCVLAYLSKRLGEALKIRPYYKILYFTSALVISGSLLDMFTGTTGSHQFVLMSIGLRFIATIAAFFVVIRYWNWLVGEYMKK